MDDGPGGFGSDDSDEDLGIGSTQSNVQRQQAARLTRSTAEGMRRVSQETGAAPPSPCYSNRSSATARQSGGGGGGSGSGPDQSGGAGQQLMMSSTSGRRSSWLGRAWATATGHPAAPSPSATSPPLSRATSIRRSSLINSAKDIDEILGGASAAARVGPVAGIRSSEARRASDGERSVMRSLPSTRWHASQLGQLSSEVCTRGYSVTASQLNLEMGPRAFSLMPPAMTMMRPPEISQRATSLTTVGAGMPGRMARRHSTTVLTATDAEAAEAEANVMEERARRARRMLSVRSSSAPGEDFTSQFFPPPPPAPFHPRAPYCPEEPAAAPRLPAAARADTTRRRRMSLPTAPYLDPVSGMVIGCADDSENENGGGVKRSSSAAAAAATAATSLVSERGGMMKSSSSAALAGAITAAEAEAAALKAQRCEEALGLMRRVDNLAAAATAAATPLEATLMSRYGQAAMSGPIKGPSSEVSARPGGAGGQRLGSGGSPVWLAECVRIGSPGGTRVL